MKDHRDHHCPQMYAGNDPREALGTVRCHDHRHNFTSHNGYRVLAGFHLLFDEVDSGNENDGNGRSWISCPAWAPARQLAQSALWIGLGPGSKSVNRATT